MNTHSIDLIRYCARSRGNSTIYLGTAGSHGNEQLQVTRGKGWEGLTVQVVFHPCKVAVQLPANGVLDVPWEATARPLTALQGRIVFQGFDQDRLVNSTDLAYTVASHSPALGRDEEPYTPGIVEGVLNQMAADKDAILQAAQQTGQAKEAAAASAAAAASSAANAQQSAGAANTSAGQAAGSASQAAGSAAAANETLTQVQTAGQEAQQKVKDAETEALGNIAAAAPALPAVSAAAAWQSVTVKPDGTGYNLAAMAPIEATIRPTVTGNPAVCKGSAAWAFQGLKIYGKSTQDGEPSPENPVPIVSAGGEGSLKISFSSKNLFSFNANLMCNSDGKTVETSYISCVIPCNGLDFIFVSGDFGLLESGSIRVGKYDAFPVVGTVGERDNIAESKSFSVEDYNFVLFTFVGKTSEDRNSILNSFCISIGNQKIPYEPHEGKDFVISTPNGLSGIPIESGGNFTDADGKQLVCDVKDYGAGKYTQNCVSAVFDGSEDENWIESSSFPKRYVARNISPNVLPFSSGLCSQYIVTAKESETGIQDVSFVNVLKQFCVNTSYATLNEWKLHLTQNPMIVVLRTTPIETPLSSEELAAYRALTTYDGTTVVSTAEPVAGIEARYIMDGNKYRESVDKRLAALEAAQTGI